MFLAILFLVLMILWFADSASGDAPAGSIRARGGFLIPWGCVAILGYIAFEHAWK